MADKYAKGLPSPGGAWNADALKRARNMIPKLPEFDSELQKQLESYEAWAQAYMEHLAARVGGGELGPGPLAVIGRAKLTGACSDAFFVRASYALGRGEEDRAIKLAGLAIKAGSEHRACITTAHELAASQAKPTQSIDPLAAFRDQGGTDGEGRRGSIDAEANIPATVEKVQPSRSTGDDE